MNSFLALLGFLQAAAVPVTHVRIPTPDGTTLDAALVRPVEQGNPGSQIGRGIAVVALHGCGGPFPTRDGSWAVTLAREGFTVLLPDSFGSRGLGSQCKVRNRTVRPSGARRQDAIAAAEWLRNQPALSPNASTGRARNTEPPRDGSSATGAVQTAPARTPPASRPDGTSPANPPGPAEALSSQGTSPRAGPNAAPASPEGSASKGATTTGMAPNGIALLGWSNGGGTVLATAKQAPDLPRGLFQRFVAFYPGCNGAKDPRWKPAAPLMVLVGEADDWTPAAPCRTLAARYPDTITLKLYPGAYHDFDAADQPVRVLTGLTTPPSGTGQAHAGTNPAARQDAMKRVPAFLAEQGSALR